ncbi:uncharacterized protein BXIN_2810 [Babesia sp. Xinjiang]|uniref:uncharacterized protein n=1 Tax=Babesia sp. Xinjiang TaxID=462227 RepID=UPI000A21EDC3|nr:uncharacterized protein BXIN_2810 [Babesia sp. Xinjiang]ORM41670.1 hypothetical protein BXIN_2810 [Babesia sp. Xinjiang]
MLMRLRNVKLLRRVQRFDKRSGFLSIGVPSLLVLFSVLAAGTIIVDKQLACKFARASSISKRELTLKEEHEEMLKMLARVTPVEQQDEYTKFRAFAGTVQDVVSDRGDLRLEQWKGKRVVGITAKSTISVNDVIDNHPISRIVMIPDDSKIETPDIVINIIPLCRALICENLHMRTVENEVVIIVAGSMASAVPYLQWLLIKNIKVAVYLPPAEADDDQEKGVDEDYKHPLFSHGKFKPLATNVIIRRNNIETVSDDALTLTNGIGASAIAVLPDAVKAFKTEEVRVSRQMLLSAGMGSRIVWQQALEQVDPCESKCLFNKGVSLSLFNFDASLEAHSSDGVVQHALMETVKRVTHKTIYVEKYYS